MTEEKLPKDPTEPEVGEGVADEEMLDGDVGPDDDDDDEDVIVDEGGEGGE